jgi:orotate phosphoribosyltransferase
MFELLEWLVANHTTGYKQDFLRFAIAKQVLSFGEYKTKAGRLSPYFFNAGLFNDGDSLSQLSKFYAQAAMAAGVSFDMLFGPAYKGIPLVAGVAMALADKGKNFPFAYNRKEAKDHGEGGILVGSPLEGRVLIVDDVISAGTSVRESVELIRNRGAQPAGVLIALDRMEKGKGELSAVQEVNRDYGIPVITIANLDDLVDYLKPQHEMKLNLQRLQAYREQYGIRA